MKALRLLIIAIISTTSSLVASPSSPSSLAAQMEETGLPVVNSMLGGSGLRPRSFRASEIVPFGRVRNINTKGLASLHVSGSSQPSPNEMDAVKKFWNKRQVHWIVLRKEEVWAIEPKGGGAVIISQLHRLNWWSGEDPRGLRTVDEIYSDEQNLVNAVPKHSLFTIYGNHDLEPSVTTGEAYELLYRIDIKAEKVFTLKQLVEQRGMIYHRINDNKFGPISWASIDQLVRILRAVPEEDAVHFHCKKGQSRTTIAMALFDMMRNAENICAEEIIDRQGPMGIGGATLKASEVNTGKSGVSYKHSWEKTLHHFHTYCLEAKADNFSIPFSTWCQKKGIVPEPEISFKQFDSKLNIHSTLPAEEKDAFDPKPSNTSTPLKGPLVLTVTDEGKQLPSNLRSTHDYYLNPSFNIKRLDTFYAVGCSQPTAQAAKILFNQLSQAFPGRPIIDIDLRHDEHWLVFSGNNGHDVNAFESFADLGTELDVNTLLAKEQAIAVILAHQPALRLHIIKEMYPKDEYGDKYTLSLVPTQVLTEKEMVENMGVSYVRIAAARFGTILDENIDQQVSLRLNNPQAVFLYHCKNGKSRTTLAMCIDDMMANANFVSFADIIQRQYALGGANLFDITAKDPSWQQEREFKRQWLIFLARFHAYCQEQSRKGFTTPWSEWSIIHPELPSYITQDCLNRLMTDKTPVLPQ